MAQLWFDKGWGDARLQQCMVKAMDGTTYVCDGLLGDGDGLNITYGFKVTHVKQAAPLCAAYDSNNNGNNAWNKGYLNPNNQLSLFISTGAGYAPKSWPLINFSICNGALFGVSTDNRLIYSYTPFWNGVNWAAANVWGTSVKKVLRVSDFGNACNFLLLTDGSIVKIDAWRHCGGLANIGVKSNYIDAGTDGIDIWAVDRQNKLWWFNGYGGYAMAECNAPGGGVVAVYVNPRGPPCTVGVIALDGGIYFAHSKQTILYTKGIFWLKGALTKLLIDVKDPNERIKTKAIDYSVSDAYIAATPWMDLNKPTSNPNFGKEMYNDDSLVSSKGSVMYRLSQKGISNFYPYKIVSLADLINSNRASMIVYQPGDSFKGFRICAMMFTPDDPYLPLGDVCLNDDYTDYSKIWVALIRNLPEYCIPNKDGDVKTQFSGWGRTDYRSGFDFLGNWVVNAGGRSYCWSVASPTTVPTRDLFDYSTKVKGQNISVGDIALTLNGDSDPVGLYNTPPIVGTASWYLQRWGQNTHPVTNSKTAVRTYALVNPTYVANIAQNNLKQSVISQWGNGAKGIKEGNGIYSISYFNTFGAGRNSKGFPLVQILFDFLPDVYVAALCSKGDTLTKWGYTNSNKPVSIAGADCPTWMNNWMNRNNYENAPNAISSEWCSSKDGKGTCDSNLYAFCQMGPDGKQYDFNASVPWKRLPPGGIPRTSTPAELAKMYPNSTNAICNAFMPEDYNIAYDYYPLYKEGDTKEMDILSQVISKGGYKYAECTPHGSQSNGVYTNRFINAGNNPCPSVAICTNNTNINAKGATFKDSPITITQSNECGGTGKNTTDVPTAAQIASTNAPSVPPPSIKNNPPAGKLPPPEKGPRPPPVSTSTKKKPPPPPVEEREWYENCSIM